MSNKRQSVRLHPRRAYSIHPLTRSSAHPLIWLLALLFLGPVIAPLFLATGLPVLAGSGALAHDLLATYVCPTPAKSYMLLGFPMAVCTRCWGATFGLWTAWWLFQRLQIADCRLQIGGHLVALVSRYLALPLGLRLALAIGALLLWTLEINTWATAPLSILLLNGAHGGFWAAMLIGSVWRTWKGGHGGTALQV
jgi:hypothetical protein